LYAATFNPELGSSHAQGMFCSPSICAPVNTATTPGAFAARLVSMRVMRACACGLRTMAACTMSGSARSSV
jgi:hypothetical protein